MGAGESASGVLARQQHCWWLAAADGSQIGHTIWRPPWLTGSAKGTTWVRLLSAAGAGCARVPRSVSLRQFFEEFPLLRCLLCRAVRTWKAGHFSVALVSSSPGLVFGCWVLLVEYSVLDFSGDSVCSPLGSTVDTCSSGGFGRNFHIFYAALNSNPGSVSPSFTQNGERAQSMLLVVVALSAVRTLTLDIISRGAAFFGAPTTKSSPPFEGSV